MNDATNEQVLLYVEGIIHVHRAGCPALSDGTYPSGTEPLLTDVWANTRNRVLDNIEGRLFSEVKQDWWNCHHDTLDIHPCTGIPPRTEPAAEPGTYLARERWLREGGWTVAPEHRRQHRGHDFYPPGSVLATIPNLYDGPQHERDMTVHLHYYSAVGHWWITNIDPGDGRALGYLRPTVNPDHHGWTYVRLPDLERLLVTVLSDHNHELPVVVVARDLNWQPSPARQAIPDLPST